MFHMQPTYVHMCLSWQFVWVQVRNQGGGHLGHIPPETFKTLHSNFDICRNFQRMKMKFYILIIFKKSYWKFPLSYWWIISLQDLSWDSLCDRKFRKWLVFNHKHAGSVKTWQIIQNVRFLKEFFIYLFVYYPLFDRPQFALMKLYNITVLLNRENCWNFQIAKRNLDITVSASSNRLFFYDLLNIFHRVKADHHY